MKAKITPYIYGQFKRANIVAMGEMLYNIQKSSYDDGFDSLIKQIQDGHYIMIAPDKAYEVLIAQKGIGEMTANHLVAELERYNVTHLLVDDKRLFDDDYLKSIDYDEEWQERHKK